jgi:NAD(P)-dependent dehydrogenase (short-subunit alcohol dehydrogenase family)
METAPVGRLQGKVALVTGGAGGIGAAICQGLASEGASVVITDLAENNEVMSSIIAGGGKAIFVKMDQSQESEVVTAFDICMEVFGAVHIVVQVAAICKPRNMTESSVEDWDNSFAVNVRGTFLVVREAARRMGPGGRIITTGSVIAGNEVSGKQKCPLLTINPSFPNRRILSTEDVPVLHPASSHSSGIYGV